jgi:hypothetical protein
MTRYYRDLHDRELLSQAEMMLAELQRRRLLDIRLSSNSRSTASDQRRMPVDSIVRNGNALSIVADGTSDRASDARLEGSSLPERR